MKKRSNFWEKVKYKKKTFMRRSFFLQTIFYVIALTTLLKKSFSKFIRIFLHLIVKFFQPVFLSA